MTAMTELEIAQARGDDWRDKFSEAKDIIDALHARLRQFTAAEQVMLAENAKMVERITNIVDALESDMISAAGNEGHLEVPPTLAIKQIREVLAVHAAGGAG